MTPESINASTWAWTFSTPASANTTGALTERVAPRLTSSSTATLLTDRSLHRPLVRQLPRLGSLTGHDGRTIDFNAAFQIRPKSARTEFLRTKAASNPP